MTIVRVRAPAKLNLTLAVVGPRLDGYHALHSVMTPLAFGDELQVEPAPVGARGDTLEIGGSELSAGPDNLVLRAIAAARAAVAPSPAPPLSARVTKKIPVAAGLGGGSSDAAAAISAALEAWGVELPAADASAVAASVGSDVPFFLAGGIALVTGRGEFVEPLPSPLGHPLGILVVTPNLAISTAAVFAAFSRGVRPADLGRSLAASEGLARALRGGADTADLLAMSADMAAANDLFPAACSVAPGLEAFREALADFLGRPTGQSGSGPTLWVLYPTGQRAGAAARSVDRAIRSGRLPAIGSGEPVAVATALAPR
jgi:4-diphosphocytidyl-2-C-methyl-D-erythritol kinase